MQSVMNTLAGIASFSVLSTFFPHLFHPTMEGQVMKSAMMSYC